MAELTIDRSTVNDQWESLAVLGEIDLATAEQFEKAIDEVHDQCDLHLVVDLTGTSFMDSTGLRSIVMADRKFRESDRQFALAVDGGPISRLIDMSGVAQSINIVSNTDDLASVGSN